MGSLMAGWDSPVLDHKSAKFSRNKSLTKEEIEAYWRSKKKTEEEHIKAGFSPRSTQEYKNHELKYMRSSSLPPANTMKLLEDMEVETNLEKLVKEHGWWTRSNWAFLNEPPVLERASNTYSSQFHVANLSNPKADAGINA